MFSIIFITVTALLFAFGIYLGYQVGSTRHIREQLAEARVKNQS